uniref:ATP-dependent transporter ycf16 n=1 Tax=Leptocylindrus danicus TaxID=163516 RepID=A0A7S2PI34_9STRA|mmetsp:Transcript_3418/g.4975  ORF Transcript_3418/g.4975 Transcript_3418/m.4975 type:complete len:619 (+) Transcript_3418:261-2117(+)
MSKENESNAKQMAKLKRKRAFAMLLEETRKEFPALAVGTASLIASSISNALLPVFLGNFYFEGQAQSSQSCSSADSQTCSSSGYDVDNIALMRLIALVVCGGLSSFLRTTCLTRVEARVTARLRRRLFHKLMGLELSHIDELVKDEDVGSFNSMLIDDTANAGKALSMTFSSIIRSAVSFLYNTYAMISISPRLCMTSVVLAPVSAAGIMALLKFKTKARAKQRALVSNAASFAEERFANLAAVKLNKRELDESEKYGDMQDEAGELDARVSVADGLFMGGIFWLTSASLAAVVYQGRKEVTMGRLSSQGLSRFVVSTFLMGLGISGVGRARSQFTSQLISAQHIHSILSLDEEKGKGDDDDAATSTAKTDEQELSNGGVLKMENIYFSYNGKDGEYVLKDLSLSLEPGRVMALVGQNGAGKSTIVSLLAGLYKPNEGSITYDGVVVSNKTTLKGRQALISVVQQEATASLFALSVMDNIKYSRPDASDEEAKEAARLANCEVFVGDLEGGYDYNIGRGGSRLSGGQRQRICLARALLANPTTLVLDEPASQLDAEGGGAVEDAVNACRESNRSLLLITHRASSLKMADSILVLDSGKIVEEKDNAEVLKRLMPDLLE